MMYDLVSSKIATLWATSCIIISRMSFIFIPCQRIYLEHALWNYIWLNIRLLRKPKIHYWYNNKKRLSVSKKLMIVLLIMKYCLFVSSSCIHLCSYILFHCVFHVWISLLDFSFPATRFTLICLSFMGYIFLFYSLLRLYTQPNH